jgi:hypothetical protein
MALFLLLAAMLGLMCMRVYLPFGSQTKGQVFKTVRLNLMERTLLQRVNVYALGLVLLVLTASGTLPGGWQAPIVVLALAVLALPVRIYVSNTGIGLNNVVYRPWTDFVGFRVEKRRVVLAGRRGLRDLALPLVGRHQSELTPALRRYLEPLLQQERGKAGALPQA